MRITPKNLFINFKFYLLFLMTICVSCRHDKSKLSETRDQEVLQSITLKTIDHLIESKKLDRYKHFTTIDSTPVSKLWISDVITSPLFDTKLIRDKYVIASNKEIINSDTKVYIQLEQVNKDSQEVDIFFKVLTKEEQEIGRGKIEYVETETIETIENKHGQIKSDISLQVQAIDTSKFINIGVLDSQKKVFVNFIERLMEEEVFENLEDFNDLTGISLSRIIIADDKRKPNLSKTFYGKNYLIANAKVVENSNSRNYIQLKNVSLDQDSNYLEFAIINNDKIKKWGDFYQKLKLYEDKEKREGRELPIIDGIIIDTVSTEKTRLNVKE